MDFREGELFYFTRANPGCTHKIHYNIRTSAWINCLSFRKKNVFKWFWDKQQAVNNNK